jgi:DNA-binding MarR family transcriptional regulator
MSTSRPILFEHLTILSNRMSNATVQYHQAAAEKFGLNATDMKTLPLLNGSVPISAGDIGASLGLTSGAVTAVIDRLERSGLVRRAPHPDDRRKVIVELVPEGTAEAYKVYQPMADAVQRFFAQQTDEQLKTIAHFMEASADILEKEALRLRTQEE